MAEARCSVSLLRYLWLYVLLIIPSFIALSLVESVVFKMRDPRFYIYPMMLVLPAVFTAASLLYERLRYHTVWSAHATADGIRLGLGATVPWASIRQVTERAQTRDEGMEVPTGAGVALELGATPVTRGSLYIQYVDAAGRPRWARLPSHAKGYQGFRLFVRRMLGERASLASWEG